MSAAEAARFAEAVRRLLPEGGRLGLAVSGGPDSLAMLLLAQAAIPGTFEAATSTRRIACGTSSAAQTPATNSASDALSARNP